MGGGLLGIAFTKYNETITLYILLGKERKNGLWCDLGGGSYPQESTFDTALREFYEESNGLIYDIDELETIVKKNLICQITTDSYTSYVFKMKYDKNLPKIFENSNKFAERKLKYAITNQKNGLFEKVKIQWFPLNHFKNPENKKKLRPFFITHIDYLLNHEEEIKKTITFI